MTLLSLSKPSMWWKKGRTSRLNSCNKVSSEINGCRRSPGWNIAMTSKSWSLLTVGIGAWLSATTKNTWSSSSKINAWRGGAVSPIMVDRRIGDEFTEELLMEGSETLITNVRLFLRNVWGVKRHVQSKWKDEWNMIIYLISLRMIEGVLSFCEG